MKKNQMPLISLVVPTYQRSSIIIETITALNNLTPKVYEILIVDQTEGHPTPVEKQLDRLQEDGTIRWIRLSTPSIPAAMNTALNEANGDFLLFLDDDITPDEKLINAHIEAQEVSDLVAGQVLQPKETSIPLCPGEKFRFNSTEQCEISEFMGGNFSIKRNIALSLGGFDENFSGAAFCFEAEFANRYVNSHGKILYQPQAIIHHLMIQRGGTRAHGHHLRTAKPTHALGAYYYLLKSRPNGWLWQAIWRPFRAVRTRHHFQQPWWIPLSLYAELTGFCWAMERLLKGPKLLSSEKFNSEKLV